MKKIYPLFIIIFSIGFNPIVNAQGGVAINTGGIVPDNSALLDVSDTNKGLLMPRMTTAQRNTIANPARGLTIFNNDCGVYNYNAGTPENPNWATINASNVLVAGVTIAASPVGAICAGTGVTFTATPSAGIDTPNYQWQINGQNVGIDSSAFTDSSLNNGDVVTCILSTNQSCVTGSPATSNAINMTVNPIPSTPGSITGNASPCATTSGNIYSVSPVASATSYNWTVPGDASITSGSGSTSIIVTYGVDSGDITVVAVNGCGVSSTSTLPVSVISGSGSQIFTFTGNEQIFTVPACIYAVNITAYGAQGGSQYGNNGALGGSAAGTLAVTPGEQLYVFVGGQNGYNGGGTGLNGGNGGGMSDVRVDGTAFSNWVIVAGGGGGGGNNGNSEINNATGTGGGGNFCGNGAGGGGGGYYTSGSADEGGAGTCSSGGAAGGSGGGWGGGAGGGGLTSGGAGGTEDGYGNAGQDGNQGLGGNYTPGNCNCPNNGAGGGGGGYYGGGGGASGCCAGGGGGGGSSWTLPSMTNLSFSGGVQSGNGEVVITW